MNHKWREIEIPEKNKGAYKKMFKCVRGECGCIKYIGLDNFAQYERAKHLFSQAPDCYGDIPLSQQSINQ